jgi:mRNA interferase RelE/StbE
MVYRIDIAKSASKQISSLETVVQKRLGKKIQELSEAKNIVTLAKMLSGDLQGVYRVRIGDYRVLFEVYKETLTILSVKHRKEAYR